jgi:hypothetical protein
MEPVVGDNDTERESRRESNNLPNFEEKSDY